MLALALALALADLPSKSYAGRNINGWIMGVQDDGCSISTSFTAKSSQLQSTIYFKYEAGHDRIWIGFGHDKFASLDPNQTYEIETDFIINGKLDNGWGKTKYAAFKDGDDKGGRLIAKFNSVDMLKDLGRATTIAFFKDDKMLTTFPIGDLAPGIVALKACASEVEREHPADPFAK